MLNIANRADSLPKASCRSTLPLVPRVSSSTLLPSFFTSEPSVAPVNLPHSTLPRFGGFPIESVWNLFDNFWGQDGRVSLCKTHHLPRFRHIARWSVLSLFPHRVSIPVLTFSPMPSNRFPIRYPDELCLTLLPATPFLIRPLTY